MDTKARPNDAIITPNMTGTPQWWTDQHTSGWDKVKLAFQRDWEQTKADFSLSGGRELNQSAGDTIAQATGTQPIPPIDVKTHPTDPKDAAKAEEKAAKRVEQETEKASETVASAQKNIDEARAKLAEQIGTIRTEAEESERKANEKIAEAQMSAAEKIEKDRAKQAEEVAKARTKLQEDEAKREEEATKARIKLQEETAKAYAKQQEEAAKLHAKQEEETDKDLRKVVNAAKPDAIVEEQAKLNKKINSVLEDQADQDRKVEEKSAKARADAAQTIGKQTEKIDQAVADREAAIAAWRLAEQEGRYGYGARSQYPNHDTWNADLEAKLRGEWNQLDTGRTWEQSKDSIHRGWDLGKKAGLKPSG